MISFFNNLGDRTKAVVIFLSVVTLITLIAVISVTERTLFSWLTSWIDLPNSTTGLLVIAGLGCIFFGVWQKKITLAAIGVIILLLIPTLNKVVSSLNAWITKPEVVTIEQQRQIKLAIEEAKRLEEALKMKRDRFGPNQDPDLPKLSKAFYERCAIGHLPVMVMDPNKPTWVRDYRYTMLMVDAAGLTPWHKKTKGGKPTKGFGSYPEYRGWTGPSGQEVGITRVPDPNGKGEPCT